MRTIECRRYSAWSAKTFFALERRLMTRTRPGYHDHDRFLSYEVPDIGHTKLSIGIPTRVENRLKRAGRETTTITRILWRSRRNTGNGNFAKKPSTDLRLQNRKFHHVDGPANSRSPVNVSFPVGFVTFCFPVSFSTRLISGRSVKHHVDGKRTETGTTTVHSSFAAFTPTILVRTWRLKTPFVCTISDWWPRRVDSSVILYARDDQRRWKKYRNSRKNNPEVYTEKRKISYKDYIK